MLKKDAYRGRYVYHSIDKAAFFKIIAIREKQAIIEQIDNLGNIDRKNLFRIVNIKDIKKDYI